jgi:cytidylate kinase
MIAAESDPSIDYDIDNLLKEMASRENIIIDSRLAYNWIPDSFKVYLEIDPDIAAKRMFYDLETNESRMESEHAKNIEDMKKEMVERHESDKRRYQKLYGIDHTDHKNFDLVINTGLPENDLEAVVKKIISEYMKACIDNKC